MFILLLKMGVNRLGPPREETSELPWTTMMWPSADIPVGGCDQQRTQPVKGLEVWKFSALHSRWAEAGLGGKARAAGWGQTPQGPGATEDPDAFLKVEGFE